MTGSAKSGTYERQRWALCATSAKIEQTSLVLNCRDSVGVGFSIAHVRPTSALPVASVSPLMPLSRISLSHVTVRGFSGPKHGPQQLGALKPLGAVPKLHDDYHWTF